MKQISLSWGYKFFLAILFTCMQVMLWAQDQTVTQKTTETTTTQWYASPWVWVAGGAVFIILIALMRGNSSTSETRTTVIKDNV